MKMNKQPVLGQEFPGNVDPAGNIDVLMFGYFVSVKINVRPGIQPLKIKVGPAAAGGGGEIIDVKPITFSHPLTSGGIALDVGVFYHPFGNKDFINLGGEPGNGKYLIPVFRAVPEDLVYLGNIEPVHRIDPFQPPIKVKGLYLFLTPPFSRKPPFNRAFMGRVMGLGGNAAAPVPSVNPYFSGKPRQQIKIVVLKIETEFIALFIPPKLHTTGKLIGRNREDIPLYAKSQLSLRIYQAPVNINIVDSGIVNTAPRIGMAGI
jgi:hypothetical protein